LEVNFGDLEEKELGSWWEVEEMNSSGYSVEESQACDLSGCCQVTP